MSVGSRDDLHAGIEAGDGLKQFRGGVGPYGDEHGGKPGVQRGADGPADKRFPVERQGQFAAAHAPGEPSGQHDGGERRACCCHGCAGSLGKGGGNF